MAVYVYSPSMEKEQENWGFKDTLGCLRPYLKKMEGRRKDGREGGRLEEERARGDNAIQKEGRGKGRKRNLQVSKHRNKEKQVPRRAVGDGSCRVVGREWAGPQPGQRRIRTGAGLRSQDSQVFVEKLYRTRSPRALLRSWPANEEECFQTPATGGQASRSF